jgi:hypothetical protein
MKKFFISLCLTTAALVVFLSSCKEEDCQTVISGLVIDSVTQQPVGDIYIDFTGRRKGFGGLASFGYVWSDPSGIYRNTITSSANENLKLNVSYVILDERGYKSESNVEIKTCSVNENIVIKLNPK